MGKGKYQTRRNRGFLGRNAYASDVYKKCIDDRGNVKAMYETETEANLVIQSLVESGKLRHKLYIYRCEKCHHFHLTKNPSGYYWYHYSN